MCSLQSYRKCKEKHRPYPLRNRQDEGKTTGGNVMKQETPEDKKQRLRNVHETGVRGIAEDVLTHYIDPQETHIEAGIDFFDQIRQYVETENIRVSRKEIIESVRMQQTLVPSPQLSLCFCVASCITFTPALSKGSSG